ncbi:MAG: sugar phosphate isomerase/epimerase, partial [Actinobacteria bacterium]|nr:sugar phosphate isomerase/epimerase [Actinomycetota bacterium]
MQFGIVAGALRVPVVEAPAAAAKLGFDGIEWSIRSSFGEDPFWDDAVRGAVVRNARAAGVKLSSVILSIVGRIDFPADPTGRDWCRKLILAAIRLCADAEIAVMMVPCFKKGRATPLDQIVRAAEDLRACAPAAQDAGVILGVEDMITAEENLDLFARIDHPAVRLYYDLGNSIHFGIDPYREVPLLSHLICQHHMKDAIWNPPLDAKGIPINAPRLLGEGDADFVRFLREVVAHGYDQWLVLETSPA